MNMQIVNKDYWDSLIIDCLSGNLSSSARVKLEHWLDESEEHRSYYAQMKELWDSSGVVNDHLLFDNERAYDFFCARRTFLSAALKSQPAGKRPLWKTLISVAAVLFPVLFLGYYTVLYFNSQQREGSATLVSEISCPNGSKTQLRLADGSIVWLNSGSTLCYTDDFGKSNRKLKLVGEAYLEVARNEELPFIVEAGQLEVKVLGTKFNVSAYSDNDEIKVFLLNGSVSLSDDSGKEGLSVVLKPMEKAVYKIETQKLDVSEEESGAELSWMHNELVFKGESFAQIIRVLQRSYDVKINIHNQSLGSRRFAGDFNLNDPIEKVIKIMASNGKFKYTIKKDLIDIY